MTERTDTAPTTSGAAVDHSARNNRVIWLLLGAAFVVILNETIMGVAIPHLKVDLAIDSIAAQWLTTAFMLTMAIVIPVTGFLLQRFSTRSMFLTAMSLFSLGTLVAALAPGFEVLLVGRVVQASGTAIMMPLLMTTIMNLVPPADRGRLMGRISIVMAVAPAIGPTLSGLILHYLDWRWMFWLVLPIALTMLLVGARKVENVSEPRRVPIDVLSVIISAFAFGGIVYGLSLIGAGHGVEAAEAAANGTMMVVSLVVGGIALVVFVVRQLLLQRRERALLDLRTFRNRNFSISIGLMAILMATLFGTLILLPLYMQEVLGLDPLQAGLLLLPGSLVMGLLGPIVGRIFDRYGPTVLLIPGSVIVSGVLWSLTTVTETTSPFLVLAAHVVLSVGLGLMFTPLFTSALGSVEPRFYSHASATVGTVQQVAGAAGTALFITIMAAQTEILSNTGAVTDVAAAGGVRAAFLLGALLSLLTVVGAIFVRKPADMVTNAPAEH